MAFPCVTISSQALRRVRNHDCWVFRDELERVDESIGCGQIVEVVDRRGEFVAYAFYSDRSHIALRVVSALKGRLVDRQLLGERLKEAIARRQGIARTNAKRLVSSEADSLPGLIVDQYAKYLIVQFRSAGMDHMRCTVVELLQKLACPSGILERSDKEFRQEEGLLPVNQVLAGDVPDRILIEEEGLRFWVDPHRGLKTGFYLDQRPTRKRLRELVEKHHQVLDVFSYTGSLGIAAAIRGAHVVCVEQQESFIELARANAQLNGLKERIEFVAGDAFYWLKAQADAKAQFDWVMLDPPSLTKNRAGIIKARQALHHLLAHGLRLLSPRGWLCLSLCTYHLLGVAEEIARIAAAECGLRLRIRDLWQQAEDHPWILQIPPTRYLASWLFERSPIEV